MNNAPTPSARILVFVPCYNCEKQVGRVLRQFDAAALALVDHILVLDNRSTDNTVDAAIEAARALPSLPVTVGRNRDNYSLGGSHKAAFAWAVAQGYTHVLVLHGDDQGDVHDILDLLRSGRHLDHDACLGSRFMRGSRLLGYSPLRIAGNVVFNGLFSLATRRLVTDLGSGLNIFGPRVLADARVPLHADDLRFNNYLLLGMFERGYRTLFFPISWREDDQVSNVKMASQALKTVQLLAQSLTNRERFWAADHRSTPRHAYDFDVMYASAQRTT